MGLANWLTLLRILLIPVFVTLLVYRRPGVALLVFAVAAFTDLLDGWVARRYKDESTLGAFPDPMADKLLLTASFITLTYLKALPFWIAAVVISRDVFLVRSEEHTSELQSQSNLVCRLLLEKKKKQTPKHAIP